MTTTQTTTKTKKAPAKKVNGKAKVAKKANGKAKVAKKANGNGAAKKRTPREGNKTQDVLAKMRSAKGITRADILEMTGWKAVSVQQLVRAQGLNPDKDLKMTDERPTVYRLTK